MVALDHVIDAEAGGIVAGNRKAHSVGTFARGKTAAIAAGVSEVAAGIADGMHGVWQRAAEARPRFSEGQHRASGSGCDRVKIRAGHFARYSNTSMASNRLEILKSMVEQKPTDSFARYGLAMEYRNTGDLEASMGEFRALMENNPDYSPAISRRADPGTDGAEEAREVYPGGVGHHARRQRARPERDAGADMLGSVTPRRGEDAGGAPATGARESENADGPSRTRASGSGVAPAPARMIRAAGAAPGAGQHLAKLQKAGRDRGSTTGIRRPPPYPALSWEVGSGGNPGVAF
jgi:hypothetical protein